MKQTYETGLLGEEIAAQWLEQHYGMRLLETRYKTKAGEIDLIMLDKDTVVFVEVKTRSSFQFGRPCEVIDEKKKQHIRRSAHCFLEELKEKGQRPRRYGFHVLEIVIEHTENAF